MTNFKKMISGYAVMIKKRRLNITQPRPFDRTKILEPFRLLTHPVATFSDIKFEGRGSLRIAGGMMTLYFLQKVIAAAAGGYLFNPEHGRNFNLLPILAQTAGIALMWMVCNWAMCTLTGGEGRIREIWTVVCYALLPMIVTGFAGIAASNVISLDEGMIYNTVQAIATGWSLLLMFLGMMVVHQYSVKKTVLSVIFTLLCMAALTFLLLLFFSILQQIVGFVSGLWQELRYW